MTKLSSLTMDFGFLSEGLSEDEIRSKDRTNPTSTTRKRKRCSCGFLSTSISSSCCCLTPASTASSSCNFLSTSIPLSTTPSTASAPVTVPNGSSHNGGRTRLSSAVNNGANNAVDDATTNNSHSVGGRRGTPLAINNDGNNAVAHNDGGTRKRIHPVHVQVQYNKGGPPNHDGDNRDSDDGDNRDNRDNRDGDDSNEHYHFDGNRRSNHDGDHDGDDHDGYSKGGRYDAGRQYDDDDDGYNHDSGQYCTVWSRTKPWLSSSPSLLVAASTRTNGQSSTTINGTPYTGTCIRTNIPSSLQDHDEDNREPSLRYPDDNNDQHDDNNREPHNSDNWLSHAVKLSTSTASSHLASVDHEHSTSSTKNNSSKGILNGTSTGKSLLTRTTTKTNGTSSTNTTNSTTNGITNRTKNGITNRSTRKGGTLNRSTTNGTTNRTTTGTTNGTNRTKRTNNSTTNRTTTGTTNGTNHTKRTKNGTTNRTKNGMTNGTNHTKRTKNGMTKRTKNGMTNGTTNGTSSATTSSSVSATTPAAGSSVTGFEGLTTARRVSFDDNENKSANDSSTATQSANSNPTVVDESSTDDSTDDSDDDSLLEDLDPYDIDEILLEGDDDDAPASDSDTTAAPKEDPPASDSSTAAAKELPPGILIPERKKTKEQHLKSCISGGKSRYKKKLKKAGGVKPTIARQLAGQPNMCPAYKKFFGQQEGGEEGGMLDEGKLLEALTGDNPDPDHLIHDTLKFHEKSLLELLQVVNPKCQFKEGEAKQILTKSLEMILEWHKQDDVSVKWSDAAHHTKEPIPAEVFRLPEKVTFQYVFKDRGVWYRVEGHHPIPICVSDQLDKAILVKLPIHCGWHLLLVLVIPLLRGWKIAAGGLCYRTRKEAKELGYDFDKLLAEFSQDLFGSDILMDLMKVCQLAFRKFLRTDEGQDQIKLLKAAWEQNWEARFKELVEYKNEHGHCNVPHRYPPNPSLGRWVSTQRQAKKGNGTCRISEDQIKMLDDIGFDWSPGGTKTQVEWNARYKELVAFKEEHGHCNVPQTYPPNPALGRWVDTQRQAKKGNGHNKISEEQIKMLDEIGFVWVVEVHYFADDPPFSGWTQEEHEALEELVEQGKQPREMNKDKRLCRRNKSQIYVYKQKFLKWKNSK